MFDARIFASKTGGDAAMVASRLFALGARVVSVDDVEKANLVLTHSSAVSFSPERGYVVLCNNLEDMKSATTRILASVSSKVPKKRYREKGDKFLDRCMKALPPNIGVFYAKTAFAGFPAFVQGLTSYLGSLPNSPEVNTNTERMIEIDGGRIRP